MEYQTTDQLIDKVIEWADERKITTHGQPMTQAIKTLEECQELLVAINKNDGFEITDAIGDIIVTLIIQAELQQTSLKVCLQHAYNQIKDRKGHLDHTGNFIKEQ